eukprot:7872335-Alexandrium_andersonii.AAC.1
MNAEVQWARCTNISLSSQCDGPGEWMFLYVPMFACVVARAQTDIERNTARRVPVHQVCNLCAHEGQPLRHTARQRAHTAARHTQTQRYAHTHNDACRPRGTWTLRQPTAQRGKQTRTHTQAHKHMYRQRGIDVQER